MYREDRLYTTEILDKLDVPLIVSVHYTYIEHKQYEEYAGKTVIINEPDMEINWYELEDTEVSREDLVHRFGEDAVKELENSLD